MPDRFQLGEYWLSRQARSANWCRTWFDRGTQQTKRASLGTGELEEAKRRLAEWVLRNRELKHEDPRDIPVSVVLQRYVDEHAAKLPSADTAKRARKLWEAFWGDDAVSDMTVQRQEAFVASLRDQGLSDGYVRRVIAVGKAALNRAFQRQQIRCVPFVKLTGGGEAFDRVATMAELRAFLNAIPPEFEHLWLYTLIRLNTGCRGDAARDLQPFQIDWRHRFIRLNPTGRKQTKKRRPTVPLTDTLRSVLRASKATERYVEWNGKKVASVRRAWHLVREAAGLPADFIPKVLRHTVATELRKRGVSGWEVSGMLGHKRGESESTTEVYAKYDPAFHAAARKALDAWMRELAKKVPRLAKLTRATTKRSAPCEFRVREARRAP